MSAEQVGGFNYRPGSAEAPGPSSPYYYPLGSEGAMLVTGWTRVPFSCLEEKGTIQIVPRTGMGFPLLLALPFPSRFGIIESFLSPEKRLGRVKEPLTM